MSERFPFDLSDLQAWVIRRKDGTIVRYNLVSAEAATNKKKASTGPSFFTSAPKASYKTSYSAWCDHLPNPANPPIFSNGKIQLYIADAAGARKAYNLFDVAIDGGSVLTVPGEHDLPNIYGDPKLRAALARHVVTPTSQVPTEPTKIIKLRWFDRDAPPVYASFWPALLKELEKLQEKKGEPLTVLTICQGGHGRSGSALAALMMCMTDYTPLDALTHIRALHCARAIESKVQHQYLNVLAEHLGRVQNAFDAEQVKSFKERLLTMDIDQSYKDRVSAGKGAVVEEREGSYL